jgi:hypothetical protein
MARDLPMRHELSHTPEKLMEKPVHRHSGQCLLVSSPAVGAFLQATVIEAEAVPSLQVQK